MTHRSDLAPSGPAAVPGGRRRAAGRRAVPAGMRPRRRRDDVAGTPRHGIGDLWDRPSPLGALPESIRAASRPIHRRDHKRWEFFTIQCGAPSSQECSLRPRRGVQKTPGKPLGGMSQHGMSSARRSFAVATAPGRGPASNLSREPPPAVMSRTLSPTWTSSRNFIQSAPLVVADRAHRRRPAAPDGVGQPIMPPHPCRPASIAPARSSLDPELSIPS